MGLSFLDSALLQEVKEISNMVDEAMFVITS